jgi:acyl carrier protein
LLGYAGQSNYGAANAILDHMATNWNEGSNGDKKNHLSSIPIVAVNWGSWGEAGMAAKGTKAYETALKQGDIPMSTNSALLALESLFERLLAQPVVSGQYAISGANLSASPWSKNPILSRLNVEMDHSAAKETSPPTKLSSGNVESSIVSLLSNHISRWEPNETLVTLGLDSLDMLQLVRDVTNTFDIDLGLQDVMNSDKTLDELLQLVVEKVVMDRSSEEEANG